MSNQELHNPLMEESSKKRNLPPPLTGMREIITGEKEYNPFKTYCMRWFLLFAFSLVSFNQCLFWLTYSPISNATILYYGLCDDFNTSRAAFENCIVESGTDTVVLLLNWGPIFYLVSLPLVMIVSRAAGSTRKIIHWSTSLCLVCVVLRLIPGSRWVSSTWSGSIYFVHVAQILNACVGE